MKEFFLTKEKFARAGNISGTMGHFCDVKVCWTAYTIRRRRRRGKDRGKVEGKFIYLNCNM